MQTGYRGKQIELVQFYFIRDVDPIRINKWIKIKLNKMTGGNIQEAAKI
jgi:hypothetical protein